MYNIMLYIIVYITTATALEVDEKALLVHITSCASPILFLYIAMVMMVFRPFDL